jgi:ATP synthase protein I
MEPAPQPHQSSKETTKEKMQSIGALSTVGLSFVLAIVLGAWFGYLLDSWMGTGPWLFLLFFALGMVAGILNVYRAAIKYIK